MVRSTRRKWLWAVSALAVLAAGSLFYVRNARQASPSAAAEGERIIRVTRGDIRFTVSGTSQLEAENVQNVTAPADGTIKASRLARNMTVKAGDVLVEISSPELESDLKNAEAALERLERELDDLTRQQNGLRVIAPATGKLAWTANLDVGSNVGKSSRLGVVYDVSELVVKLPFAAEDAESIAPGMQADVSVVGLPLTKTGVVRSVSSMARAGTGGARWVDVEIAVENDGTLDAGLSAGASVDTPRGVMASQASGTLAYARTVAVLSDAAGTVRQLLASSGDMVRQGDALAVLANDSLADDIAAKTAEVERQKATVAELKRRVDELVVRAPFDGVFSTDFAGVRTNVLAQYPVGAAVKAGTLFGAVANLERMVLPIQVDELDLPNVKPGLKAVVRVEALPGKTWEGEVTQVSTVGTTTNGVTYYDAIVSVANGGNQELKHGMTATADIRVQEKQNILLLPIEALQFFRGQAFVTLKRPDGTIEQQHPVQIGLRNEASAEIVSGLQEGDEVVVPNRSRQQNLSQEEINRLRQQMIGGFGGGNFGQPPVFVQGGSSGARRGGQQGGQQGGGSR